MRCVDVFIGTDEGLINLTPKENAMLLLFALFAA